MNILFFDIESNGLPRDYKGEIHDLDNWPRIIQLGWQIADENDIQPLGCDHSVLIRPDGWKIPEETFWIMNEFSTSMSEAIGIPLPEVIDLMVKEAKEHDVQIIVSHNIGFDVPVLASEMIRYGKAFHRKLERICTMVYGVNVCKIPFGNDHRPWKNNNYKWPKLVELYKKLFDEDFLGVHDAGNDVSACRRCFFELVKRGVIQLPIQNLIQ